VTADGSASDGFTFAKKIRLRKRREFLAAQRKGRRHHTAHFIVISAASDATQPRFGVTVSREVGGSVVRNRVKRRVREFFRLRRASVCEAKDWVVIAKRGAEKLSYGDVEEELAAILVG
jgi:ribonuclease P protein component